MEVLLNNKCKSESDEILKFIVELSEEEKREFATFLRGAKFARELQRKTETETMKTA